MARPERSDLRRLLTLARPELRRLVLATIALGISSGTTLVYPQAVRYMVDAVVGGTSPISLDTGAILLVIVFAIQAVFTMLRSWLFTIAGERIVTRLRADLFRAILDQDTAFFDAARTGELTNRLASDTTVLQNSVTVNVSMGLRYLVGSVGGLALLMYMSPILTGLAMGIVPVIAIGGTLYGRTIRKLSRQVQDALARSTEVAEESIAGIRTVRSFAREEHEVERYAAAVEDSYQLAAKRALAGGAFGGLGGFAGYSAIALVVWYGGRLVAAGAMTIGDLTAFLLYTGLVAVSLGALAGLYGDFMRAIGASQRVFELLDQKAPLEMSGGSPAGELAGALRFEGVRFAYPSRPDVEVLADFELEVNPGEVVALVGPSGAGKSTVAALIARFYDPTAGRITIDGRLLTGIDPRSLRERIGAVMQEPVLFATSIADNIRYGRSDAGDDEIVAAAEAANAAEFIRIFPEGYATMVGERGVRLSGGQKQRIAIARAVLKDPRILILDEATSALDAESEHLVKEALERLMQRRTTIVIAHRLSTVMNADRVLVLDHGRLVEQGRHRDLMAADGLYKRLVERQFG